MIKDIVGSTLKEGHLVLIKIGSEWVPAKVHKLEPGGMIVPINPTQAGKTSDKIEVIFELNLADAQPGHNHPVIRRIPNPATEVICPITIGGTH